MHRFRIALVFGALALSNATADAQTSIRVRGTITAVGDSALSVKSIDGKDLQLALTKKTTVSAARALKLADLKPGDYVGATTTQRVDGALVASEVHTIARSVKEGHGPWDHPGTMMTNANVAAVVVQAAGSQELTLEYKGGTQKILVPPDTPVVTTTPADRSFLKPGEYVFVVTLVDADGKMTALRIQVSRDGVKPPQ